MLKCHCLQYETQNVKLESVTCRGLLLSVAAGGVLQGTPRQGGALQGCIPRVTQGGGLGDATAGAWEACRGYN